MYSTRHALTFAALVAALCPVALAQDVHVDKANGFQVVPPRGWSQVPIQVEEKWIAVKWLSDKKFQDKESGYSHNPLLRVIVFESKKAGEAAGAGGTATTGGGSGSGSGSDAPVELKPGDELDLSRPYLDYVDYLKRNFRDGGFYVSEEKDAKMGAIPVKMREVKIEKLVVTGKKRFICWSYKTEWGELALEVDCLEQHFEKFKPTILETFKTFKVIARDPNAKKADVGGGPKLVVADPNETPEQLKKRRKEAEDKMFKKAVADLPPGWTSQRTPNFLLLSHANPKFMDKVAQHGEAVRKWLDLTFGDIGGGYVQGCIIRICKNRDEENAFNKGSGDAWSSDSREIVLSEGQGSTANIYEFQALGANLIRYYFHDKNEDLYQALPVWMEYGLREYIGTAVLKGNGLSFEPDSSELRNMREGKQKNKFVELRKLFEMTSKDLFSGEDSQYLYAQCTSVVRYLMGPGKGVKKHGTLIRDYMKNLLAVVLENEKAARAATKTAGTPQTEAEEEEAFKQRKKQDWSAKEKEFLKKVSDVTFGSWKDGDWAQLQAAWTAFAK